MSMFTEQGCASVKCGRSVRCGQHNGTSGQSEQVPESKEVDAIHPLIREGKEGINLLGRTGERTTRRQAVTLAFAHRLASPHQHSITDVYSLCSSWIASSTALENAENSLVSRSLNVRIRAYVDDVTLFGKAIKMPFAKGRREYTKPQQQERPSHGRAHSETIYPRLPDGHQRSSKDLEDEDRAHGTLRCRAMGGTPFKVPQSTGHRTTQMAQELPGCQEERKEAQAMQFRLIVSMIDGEGTIDEDPQ
ncbi:hypothetical protein DFH27DRAFT_652096 [Peziza echinospora]|nr:hypothetical protein DFH27DRAFT_652096 [Peziza echinospora]